MKTNHEKALKLSVGTARDLSEGRKKRFLSRPAWAGSLVLFFAAIALESAPADTVVRTMPPSYFAGSGVPITITYSAVGSGDSLIIEETLPPGWTADTLSTNAKLFKYDATSNKVKWLFNSRANVTVSYIARIPAGESGAKKFVLTTSVDGVDADLDYPIVPNQYVIDTDEDTIPNSSDIDIDGDGIANNHDPDIDGDGILNEDDLDADGDGFFNTVDPSPRGISDDIDNDGILNANDPDVDGDGIPNGSDPDINGDGILNGNDVDMDSDGIANFGDTDVDGDGIGNLQDPDVDGDGILNASDPNIDGDLFLNEDDTAPYGYSGVDTDKDGIINAFDTDIDGDGMPNDIDLDVDGDGIVNNHDPDVDGDGYANAVDWDVDGDFFGLEEDPTPNGISDDVDGDGILNVDDPDIDGDGIPNAYEDKDLDGDARRVNLTDSDGYYILDPVTGQVMTSEGSDDNDPDLDSDGILNEDDPTPRGVSFHPADTNTDGKIDDIEIADYVAAYLASANWPMPPPSAPVADSYLNQAKLIYLSGEKYTIDSSKKPPLLWAPAP